MAPIWNELKADGRVIADAPRRKLAAYANRCGHVVLLSVDDGKATYIELRSSEIKDAIRVLAQAGEEATVIAQEIDAQYEAFLALEKAAK